MASRTVTALRPHAPVLRLAVLFVLAFLLAFYLDARKANAHGPASSVSTQPDLSVDVLVPSAIGAARQPSPAP